MKILVFDDTSIHRTAAKLLLAKDHNLTVVGTYDEAQGLLVSKTDYDLKKQIFAQKYGDDEPYKNCENRDERLAYYDSECKEKATTHPDFDVVLTDLLVPASSQAQGGEGAKFVGQEMPLGTTIALLALCAGTKMVAVVTDKNHHHHPASAAFDCFNDCKAEGLKIMCTNHVSKISIDEVTGELVEEEFLETEKGKVKYPYPAGETYGDRKGIVYGKNWKKVLENLIRENVEG